MIRGFLLNKRRLTKIFVMFLLLLAVLYATNSIFSSKIPKKLNQGKSLRILKNNKRNRNNNNYHSVKLKREEKDLKNTVNTLRIVAEEDVLPRITRKKVLIEKDIVFKRKRQTQNKITKKIITTASAKTKFSTTDVATTTRRLISTTESVTTNEFPANTADGEDMEDTEDILKKYTACFNLQYRKNMFHIKGYVFPELEKKFRKICFKELFGNENGNICRWSPNQLVGPLLIDMEPIDFNILQSELKFVKMGGWWKPYNCIPRHKVAIIIPFRDRKSHLSILLRQLHAILKRQDLMYRIIVVEQVDEYPFNRGKLMNVGYKEALKLFPFTCFVFHDVDLIPENDLNDYGCPSSPRHLSCAVDKFDYELPYPGIFGGVEMFVKDDFVKVNGFPNGYWGWGAEDDNLYKRLSEYGLTLSRPSMQEGRYKMIKHAETQEKPPNRYDKLSNAQEEFQTDGISSLQYTVLNVEFEPLYTKVRVDLNMEGDIIN